MRRRILLLSVGMTTLVVLAFAVPLTILLRNAAEDDSLEAASYTAKNVAYYVGDRNHTAADVTAYIEGVKSDVAGRISVLMADGTTLGDPPPGGVAAPKPVPGDHGDDDGDDRKGPPKISDPSTRTVAGGVATEIDVDTHNGPASVCLFLTSEQLYDGLLPRILLLLAGSLLVLLLSILGAELVSRRLARPLEETARTAERLAKGDVDARAPTSGPAEVAKVGAALNGLADRIDEVIAVEREAVADLSHRLRTPLTALRLQVEALPDRERAEELNTQVNSLERTLTAVISAARRPQREGRVPHCDAVDVTRQRAAFWEPLFEDQGRELVLDLPTPPAMVRSSAEDLGAALDALVENVVAHTPDGTSARIILTRQPVGGSDGVLIAVADEGPGIPLGAGERGRSDRGSTGLGLDIARRCAEAAGGRLTIHPNLPTGSSVHLTLAAP
ncbi:signal transduction histidine kinase [Kribbella orskensis]|uniref:Signal transduction histidine-protein kinase/phosphatase MprB n=1 Tax=Kribbella orskensis TaxID=2512216 RepID=A0ABY2BUM4_9ACTN|nr:MULTISPECIES: HAMP domain-containing sensor histidine kinase [Kribbella]TCN44356.1 signal transduction histidine kinase [Kribbella sp. VKM Ac-2500]TCO31866.1 signal transduction histidine kinase [Kribbella orskensis]